MKKPIRVYLRAFEPEDNVLLHKWRNDAEISLSYSGTRRFTSNVNEMRWVEERIFDKVNVCCALCIKETDEFIGCVFLSKIDNLNRSGHCATFIGVKEHWGKGYGTEARILILQHAFHDKGLVRIWSHIHEDNLGSLRMHEKCGYKFEGLLRRASYVDGVFKNLVTMSVLQDEFQSVSQEYDI